MGTIRQIGIISDTHSLLRPEAVAGLAGSDLIIHAGDIGKPNVLDALRAVAPLYVVRGNIDRDAWSSDIPEVATFEFAGKSIYIRHDLAELDIDPAAAGVDLVVTGHSHHPKIESRDGVLYINPGSAGPRRFKLPVTIAQVAVTNAGLDPELIHLDIC
jgi:putative phosphoesterase